MRRSQSGKTCPLKDVNLGMAPQLASEFLPESRSGSILRLVLGSSGCKKCSPHFAWSCLHMLPSGSTQEWQEAEE